MVSYEVQEKAEFLIHRATSIEHANKQLAQRGSHYYSQPQQRYPEIRRIGSLNIAVAPSTITTERGGERPLVLTESGSSSDQQPLADDLSSHVSESDGSTCVADNDNDDGENDEPQRLGPVYEEYGLNILDWQEKLLWSDAIRGGGDLDSMQAMYDSFTRSKQAMHQILLNADLKMRKLQYEVFMLQRVYEDAKLTVDRSQHKIDMLERKLAEDPRLGQQQEGEGCAASAAASSSGVVGDLRMAGHLNKLLASRSRALDENLKLKKQLLLCCSACRSRITPKQEKSASSSSGTMDLASSSGETVEATQPSNHHSQHRQPQSSAHRPTFQKTAYAMVRKIGTNHHRVAHGRGETHKDAEQRPGHQHQDEHHNADPDPSEPSTHSSPSTPVAISTTVGSNTTISTAAGSKRKKLPTSPDGGTNDASFDLSLLRNRRNRFREERFMMTDRALSVNSAMSPNRQLQQEQDKSHCGSVDEKQVTSPCVVQEVACHEIISDCQFESDLPLSKQRDS
ncbi:hypothetical protein ACA910_021682 [Epithemia clementina (nom. ined.)]